MKNKTPKNHHALDSNTDSHKLDSTNLDPALILPSSNLKDSGFTRERERESKKRALTYRLKFLQNEIFYKRYIKQNVYRSYFNLFGFNPKLNRSILAFIWRALCKVAHHMKWFERVLRFLLRLYFIVRFLRGKVDMPYIELVLTTKCTMRCEACNNMMQYFSKETYYTCTLNGILASLETLFKVIDSVRWVRIIGGEPLLFKDLAQVVWYLRESPKVKVFDIVTNATIDFKEDVLNALKGTHKALVSISDYKVSSNLTIPLRQESIIKNLKQHKIAHCILWSDEDNKWFDPGRIYKRNRSKQEIVKNFRACMMSCVSVMSAEGVKDSSLAKLGAAFICPIASSLSRLKGLQEFKGDFIDFAAASKERVIEFYTQDFFKVCDYCHNMWEEKRSIPIATQTKEVFSIENKANP